MKAPVVAPIPGALKTEFVAATTGSAGTEYLSRALFKALKLDWKTFSAEAGKNTESELKQLKIEYVRDRKNVILYARVRSETGLVASAVVASKFPELFTDTLGDKTLVAIPNRFTAYVFPSLASNFQEYAPLIFAAYRATAYPVSTEVFALSRQGIQALGAFEEP